MGGSAVVERPSGGRDESSEGERENRKRVGRKIVVARRELGLQQRDLAAALAVNQPRLSDWERGKHLPSVHALMRIARLTRKPYSWFFEDDGE